MAFKDSKKKQIWQSKVQAWLSSGLSGIAWCRENNESWNQLYYWKNEIFPNFKNNIKDTVINDLSCSSLYFYSRPTDMRKSFESLTGIVVDKHEEELALGALFGFVNNRYNRIKILYWSKNGLVIWNKRLERGKITIEVPEFFSESDAQFIKLI
jgi:hypothetical protein